MKLTYSYVITVVEVVDGDTVKANIDMGWDTWRHNQPIRLNGYDSPEKSSSNPLEKQASAAVLKYVQSLLPKDTKTMLMSHSLDKYGRVLGEIMLPAAKGKKDSVALSTALLAKKIVRPYTGDKKKPWTDAELQAILDILK
jgi:endonuclease YncB( thermonuclease family)